ncbi:ALK and LTK ligand 2b [Denticeps clupeoides]|uniref:ALK and LTK ligand 2 n=1 Tax=Denticeps clupeoides TaxID=299321 RepID=A0AAY4AZ19_9TELE|nr:ALK and LTK ligand 2-like [Denticeps clupeoides]XP_028840114.1 ALK and LTK ligand 2-like [Denticeps clupeoides]
MRALRAPVLAGVLLLLLTAGHCGPTGSREGRSLLEAFVDRARAAKGHQAEDGDAKRQDYSVETKEVNEVNKSQRSDQVLEVFPRDLSQKERFLTHLTGPLYFSPKCSKHFYRLYHNTRDCTIPAYYKRCARLLTRLAGSQRCSEG